MNKTKEMEIRVLGAVIDTAIEQGFLITVDNGEDIPVKNSQDKELILSELFATDMEWLKFQKPGQKRRGTMLLVHGNDGWDVINDYSTSVESIMESVAVNKVIDECMDEQVTQV